MKKGGLFETSFWFCAGAGLAWVASWSSGMFGSEHLLSAAQVRRGLRLYGETFEVHAPLTYYLLSLPLYVDDSLESIRRFLCLLCGAAASTMVSVLRRFGGKGAWSRSGFMLLFLFLATPFYWFAALPETPALLFVAGAYWLIRVYRGRSGRFAALGLITGLLFLVKQNIGVFFLGAGMIYLLVSAAEFPGPDRGRRLRGWAVQFGVGLAVPMAVFLWAYRFDLTEVWFWLFTYVTGTLAREAVLAPGPASALWPMLVCLLGCTIVYGAAWPRRDRIEGYPEKAFVIVSSLVLLLTVYPRYGDSHLAPSLPGFVLALAVLFADRRPLRRIGEGMRLESRRRATMLGIAGLALALFWAVRAAPGQFDLNRRLLFTVTAFDYAWTPRSEEILSRLPRSKPVFIFPSIPEVYFVQEQRVPKFNYPDFPGVDNDGIKRLIAAEMAATGVEHVIADPEFLSLEGHLIAGKLRAEFEVVESLELVLVPRKSPLFPAARGSLEAHRSDRWVTNRMVLLRRTAR